MADQDHKSASAGVSIDSESGVEPISTRDVREAVDAEHALTAKQAFRSYKHAVIWCLIAGFSTVMESYDTLIIASFYAYPSFKKKFGVESSTGTYAIPATWQSGLSGGSSAGLIIGGILNGYLAERFGPRKVIMACHASLIGFIFITFFAPNIKVLLVGEILCSLPWGILASLIPAYTAELCPVALRSYLTSYVNIGWVTGHLIAAGVLRGLVSNTTEWSYRIPFAIQWIWPPFLLVAIYFAPESPWWQVRRGNISAAEKTVQRLYTHDSTSSYTAEEHVKRYVALISHTIETEKRLEIGTGWIDLFRGNNLRRTEIALLTFGCQNLPGFIIQSYVTYFLELSGVPTTKAYILSIGIYSLAFFGNCTSWFLQARAGRRAIYIGGLAIMSPLMFLVGFLALAKSTTTILTAQSAFLLLWFFTYDATVGPLPYTIAAEVGASRLRNKTISFSRSFYYALTIISSVAGPYALSTSEGNLKGKAAFPGAICAALLLIWAFFRLPEMKGRTYEELDVLFENGVPARKFKGYKVEITSH